MTILFSFIAQEIPVKPKSVPDRILIITISFSGAILFWSYSACLTSFLTVENYVYPITSFQV